MIQVDEKPALQSPIKKSPVPEKPKVSAGKFKFYKKVSSFLVIALSVLLSVLMYMYQGALEKFSTLERIRANPNALVVTPEEAQKLICEKALPIQQEVVRSIAQSQQPLLSQAPAADYQAKNSNTMMYDSAAIEALIQQKKVMQPVIYQQPLVLNAQQTLTSDEVVALFRRTNQPSEMNETQKYHSQTTLTDPSDIINHVKL